MTNKWCHYSDIKEESYSNKETFPVKCELKNTNVKVQDLMTEFTSKLMSSVLSDLAGVFFTRYTIMQ